MVPKGWELTCLGDIADTTMGYAFKSKDFVKNGIPLIRMGNLYQNKLDLSRSPIFLPREFAADYERFVLKSGDLVMSMTGTMGKRDYGFTVQIPEGTPDSLLNQRVMKFESKANSYLEYLKYLLRSEFFLARLYAFPGGTKQANISALQVREIPTLLPPRPEQQKIAQLLSTWDNAISTTEKLITNSKQQKKALMQQLLTGKKRLVNPETGKAFEGDWEEITLGQLGQTFTGLTGKTKNDFGDGAKYVPYINIFKNSAVKIDCLERVKVYENEKQNTVKYGDIFFTTSSETPEEVGMSSVMLTAIDEPVYLNSFCFGFRPNNLGHTLPEFMQYLLRSNKVRKPISVLAQGATRYNLSKVQLLKISFNIPSAPEQQQIASALKVADKEIELLEAKLAHFKQEKKALMQQLLTGKRRVKIAA